MLLPAKFILCISIFAAITGFAKDKTKSLPTAIPGGVHFIRQHPNSDENKDGILTRKEQEDYSSNEIIKRLGADYTYQKKMVPMRDGVKLATAIFVPKGKGPFPAVITRTAYGIWAAAFFNAHRFTNKNFAYITQDPRGDGESEGKGTCDVKSFDNEINDGYDTIEWIAKQSWSNER